MSIRTEERRIILASGSPRRRELVSRMGIEPVVRVANIPEAPEPTESPEEYTRRLACEKAQAVANALAQEDGLPEWILAADTVVVSDGAILEKPIDDEDAVAMLQQLSGRAHQVMTSFAIYSRLDERVTVDTVTTQVWFRDLDEAAFRRYVATGEPHDKAGSYGIQGIGSLLVDRIEGCYFNVVGLPISRVAEAMEGAGVVTGFPLSPGES